MTVTALVHSLLLMACLSGHVQVDAFHMDGMRRAIETAGKEPHRPEKPARILPASAS